MTRVVILVAAGHDPDDDEPRRGPLEARAIELGLRLTPDVDLLYAGDPEEPSLPCYLNMGVKRAFVVPITKQALPTPALIEALKNLSPDIVIAGAQALDGVGSGTVPYAIASALSWPLLPNAVDLKVKDDTIEVTQGLGRGRQRKVASHSPAIVTVAANAPSPRGNEPDEPLDWVIEILPIKVEQIADAPQWDMQPAKPRGQHLNAPDPNASAAERLAAVSGMGASIGAHVQELAPKIAARKLIDHLSKNKLIHTDNQETLE